MIKDFYLIDVFTFFCMTLTILRSIIGINFILFCMRVSCVRGGMVWWSDLIKKLVRHKRINTILYSSAYELFYDIVERHGLVV